MNPVILMMLMASSAATQPCAEREKVTQRLTANYGETVKSIGLGANNGVMEVWASEETGTWTITVTMPNGQTCLIASGQAYEGGIEMLLGDET